LARGGYIPMFDDQTYENILDRSLSRISDEFDKREGSVIFDAIAPMALELTTLYGYLDFLFKNAFADTANRYWLVERAKERGIEPHLATRSIVVGKFDKKVELGNRFSVDDLYFQVYEFIEEKEGLYYYELYSESEGTIGNIESGRLVPAQSINGLKVSEIDRLIVLGEDEEETEHFRERYYETINSKAFGGNIADYRLKTKEIDGVGAVRVIPVWDGGGTVKVIITDSEYGEPTPELVEKSQEIIDPVPFHQKGVGTAPIGHYVTVIGAKKRLININCKIEVLQNSDIGEIKTYINDGVENYLLQLRKEWENLKLSETDTLEKLIVRQSKILSIVLNAKGVIDYREVGFVEDTNQTIELGEEEIPFLGNLNIEVV